MKASYISHFIFQSKSRSRAVSTKRTILSPFTKEYRVRAANSGIRLFLEGASSWDDPYNFKVQTLRCFLLYPNFECPKDVESIGVGLFPEI